MKKEMGYWVNVFGFVFLLIVALLAIMIHEQYKNLGLVIIFLASSLMLFVNFSILYNWSDLK